MESKFAAVVLAGERPGGSDFSRELGLAASVLVDVAGKSALARVIEALEASESLGSGVLCGPTEDIYLENPEFRQILQGTAFSWMQPKTGPSASALAAIKQLNRFPTLLTAGDHALLTAGLVDDFCARALELDVDVVVGLTPYSMVRAAFPESKRTVLKFSNGEFCGTNLFAVLNREGMAGPAFWSHLEADRKRPWRMARKGGLGVLLKYLFGRLSLESALGSLSQAMGCRLGYVLIDSPRAAVDVDSVADRDLAVKILAGEAKINRGRATAFHERFSAMPKPHSLHCLR
jgi:molybdopterin-guanine dinucleotide biosynthesis protein A